MKKSIITLSLFVSSFAAQALTPPRPPVHLDLDATSAEYARFLKTQKKRQKGQDDPAIARALALGQRLSAWLALENGRRTGDQQLRLTNASNRPFNSIEHPKQYNPASVAASLEKLSTDLPASMLDVLNGAAFPDALPLPDNDFVVLARKVDMVYQTAARWKSLSPYIEEYKGLKAWDMRPYYYFKSNGWTAERMQGFGELSDADKATVRNNLVGMCLNTGMAEADCAKWVAGNEEANALPAAFTLLFGRSQEAWDSFFNIPDEGVRKDVTFTDPNLMLVPFQRPEQDKFRAYLQDNIEAEWTWGDWHLRMDFRPDALAHLTFQTGVVPHVEGIGGNVIVMDDNQPIEEYESKWTIRHEYGHVIGFPDCYHEFYDEDLQAFVSYQLDVTDLMCSRAGNLKERHATELKRVYFQPEP